MLPGPSPIHRSLVARRRSYGLRRPYDQIGLGPGPFMNGLSVALVGLVAVGVIDAQDLAQPGAESRP
jgi:hypothetical protein